MRRGDADPEPCPRRPGENEGNQRAHSAARISSAHVLRSQRSGAADDGHGGKLTCWRGMVLVHRSADFFLVSILWAVLIVALNSIPLALLFRVHLSARARRFGRTYCSRLTRSIFRNRDRRHAGDGGERFPGAGRTRRAGVRPQQSDPGRAAANDVDPADFLLGGGDYRRLHSLAIYALSGPLRQGLFITPWRTRCPVALPSARCPSSR